MRFLLLFCLGTFPLVCADKKDIAFSHAGGETLRLDAHVPEGTGPFPAAILVHGGGFDQGNKQVYITPLFDVMSQAGFTWFSIDYRLAPRAHVADAVADVNEAISWVKANAKHYHADTSKLVLAGESAGGYLVNWIGTHQNGANSVAAVVDFYGPSDYLKLSEERRDHPELFDMNSVRRHIANGGGMRFFGADKLDDPGRAKLQQWSPIHYVSAGMPPFLCIHGNKDDQVSYAQSTEFCSAIKTAGARCDLITVEGGKHGMSGWKTPEMQAWKGELTAWLKKTLNL